MAWSSQPTAPAPSKSRSLPEIVAERYQIVELLGEGAMGTVYRARDLMLEGDEVALKLLRPELGREAIQRTRFLREVQYTRLVSHPNVVRTFDLAEYDDQLYFSMEVLRGETLYDYLQNNPYDFKKRLDLLVQLCSGLAAIHQAGVIHRDLKSTNIIIVTNNIAKITDFGIARSTVSELTGAEEILGSAPYLPPEVWTGADISARSDLYALGVLAYELFTNDLPFYAESAAEMMRKHLSEPAPSLRERMPELPLWLDHLVKSLLEKEGAHRPRTAQAVLATIERHRALAEYDHDTSNIQPNQTSQRSKPEDTLKPNEFNPTQQPMVESPRPFFAGQSPALASDRGVLARVISVCTAGCIIALIAMALIKVANVDRSISTIAWWMLGRSCGVVAIIGIFLAPLTCLIAWQRSSWKAIEAWIINLAGLLCIWISTLVMALAQTRLASSDATMSTAFDLANKSFFASAAPIGEVAWLQQVKPGQWVSLVPGSFLAFVLILHIAVSRIKSTPHRLRFFHCIFCAAVMTIVGLGGAMLSVGTQPISSFNALGVEISIGLLSLILCAVSWTLPLLIARLEGSDCVRR